MSALKKYRKRIQRIFLFLLIFLVSLIILISLPPVQTAIAKEITKSVNEKFKTDINIDRVGLSWNGDLVLRKLLIKDHQADTLLFSEKVSASILSFRSIYEGNPDLSHVDFDGLDFYLTTYKDELDDNLTLFIERFENDNPSSGEPFVLMAEEVNMEDSHIRIRDENQELELLFDFRDLILNAQDLKIVDDQVSLWVTHLYFNERNDICVNHMSGHYTYGPAHMEIKDLRLQTAYSNIGASVMLDYPNKLGDFINKVTITANFEPSAISTNDLSAFYDEFGRDETLILSGEFKGTLNDFAFNTDNTRFRSTRIRGRYQGKNLLSTENGFSVSSANHNISTSYTDLKRLLPNTFADLPQELMSLGVFDVNGSSTVTGSTLESDVYIATGLGDLQTVFEMGQINEIENATYKGFLRMDQFNLGTFVGTSTIGVLDGSLNFDGRGFNVETVKSSVNGRLNTLEIMNYPYRGVSVSGTLQKPEFNGAFTVNDPNLQMDFEGLIDVSEAINRYDFTANVDYADLNKLNLVKRDSISIFSGSILMDMTGTNVDDAVGMIEFKETIYQNLEDYYYFDDLIVEAGNLGEEREIKIISPDVVNGRLVGKFKIMDLPNLFRNGVGSIYANYQPIEVTTNQYLDYEFEVFSKIVDVFVPEIKLGENSRVTGSVSSDESEFKLNFNSPEIGVYGNYLGNIKLRVDNDNPLFNTYIQVDSVDLGFYDLKDMELINFTLKDTLFIRSEFAGGKDNSDKYNLSLYHTINPEGKSVVGVKRSTVEFKEKTWYINKNNNRLNKIVFDNNFKDVRIDSLVMNHKEQSIQMAGFLRGSDYKDFKLNFTDVDIGNITPVIENLDLYGIVNGRLNFLQRDGAYYPDSNVEISDVSINDVYYGDLVMKVAGNEDLSQYDVNCTLSSGNVKAISAVGGIDLRPREPQIALDVRLDRLNLSALTPFGTDVITDIRGFASGFAKVSGSYKNPDIKGKISMDAAGLSIPYLNVDYAFADAAELFINGGRWDLGNIPLTDTKYGSGGILSGYVTHQKFQTWNLNLKVITDNLLVLDTPFEEDALYYGTAFVSGETDIYGPTDALTIDVIAATEPNTVFNIPLSDVEALGEEGYIRFLSPEEKAARLRGEAIAQEKITGLEMNFDLDINENALLEVVIDQKSGSKLRGRGAGIILVELNTLGKFNMWGDFRVIEGKYDFKYQNIISKTIDVDDDGLITWNGDPTRANLDIKARYKTTANPSVLLDNPGANRKINVDAVVALSGEILKPELDFFVEFPRANNVVADELKDKLRSKEQREQQAIFLLAIDQFQDTAGGFDNPVGSVVSQAVGSVLNDLLNDKDSKLNIEVAYDVGDRRPDLDTGDRFRTTISANITDRIIINGEVGIPVGGVNDTQVAGDVEIQWLINEDGSLRMNFFNRQAQIQFIGEQLNFEQGAGISYTVDFDTFRELVKKIFNKNIELEADSTLNVVPDDSDPDLGPVNFGGRKNDN